MTDTAPRTADLSEAEIIEELDQWLNENWDPEITVEEWWNRLGLSGWGAPAGAATLQAGMSALAGCAYGSPAMGQTLGMPQATCAPIACPGGGLGARLVVGEAYARSRRTSAASPRRTLDAWGCSLDAWGCSLEA